MLQHTTRMLAVTILLALPGAAGAQAFDPDAFYQALAERLELSEEQWPRVKSALRAHGERLEDIRDKRRAGEIRKREAFRRFRDSRTRLDEELRDVLDPSQLAELEAARSELREKARQAREGRR